MPPDVTYAIRVPILLKRQALVVYDVDGTADSLLSVSFECSEGELILGDSSGLIFDTGESIDTVTDAVPSPSSVLRFNGTATAINLAMRNLRYRGLSGRVGQDVIRIEIVDDPGPCPGDFNISGFGYNTTAATRVNGTLDGEKAAPCALGGPRKTEGEIQVFLSAINRPPSVNVPSDGDTTLAAVDSEKAVNIGAGGKLSVEDPDVRETAYYSAGGLRVEGPISVAIICASGRLSLGVRGGLSFSEGEGLSDPVVRFSGAIDDANRALASLSYRCSSAYECGPGTHSITVEVDDNGFTGSGGPMSASATFPVKVAAAGT